MVVERFSYSAHTRQIKAKLDPVRVKPFLNLAYGSAIGIDRETNVQAVGLLHLKA